MPGSSDRAAALHERENRYFCSSLDNAREHTIGFRQSPEYQDWKALR